MSATCYYDKWYKKKLYKRLLYGLLAFVILVSLIIFIIWAVLRPTKPTFSLKKATIIQLNNTSPTTLTTVLQVTIQSHNPNDRIAILYDSLSIYASYHGQQLTLGTSLPAPTFQGYEEDSLWSPYLQGPNVPVASFIFDAYSQDKNAGIFPVDIKVDGRLRWKVGTWMSGQYGLYVSCPAYIRANGAQPPLEMPEAVGCSTTV